MLQTYIDYKVTELRRNPPKTTHLPKAKTQSQIIYRRNPFYSAWERQIYNLSTVVIQNLHLKNMKD